MPNFPDLTKNPNHLSYTKEGDIRLSRTKVTGTITQNVNAGQLTLRLFLTKKQKEDLLLQSGEFTSMKIIIM